jgi:hypothetical protein
MPGPTPPAAPAATPKTSDLGPSPGKEFVKIKYVKASDYGTVGTIEWCEQRNAANLVKAGLVEVLPIEEK